MPWSEFRIWNRSIDVRDLRKSVRGGRVLILTGTGVSLQLAKPIEGLTKNDKIWEIEKNLNWLGLIKNGFKDERIKVAYIDAHTQGEKQWEDNCKKLEESGNDLLGLAQVLQDCKAPFCQWIKQVFCVMETVANYSIAAALDSLDAPILTTNYDNLLSKALSRDPISSPNSKDFYDKLRCELNKENFSKKHIYHLHGHYKTPENIIFGEESYDVLVNGLESTFQVQAETHSFTGNSLLFVGVGAGGIDPHWRLIILSLSKLGALNNIYWLVHINDIDDLRSEAGQLIKCKTAYSKIKFITFHEYGHLPLLLLSLRKWAIPESDETSAQFCRDKPIRPNGAFSKDELKEHIDNKNRMILTIDGPGGAGKTTKACLMLHALEQDAKSKQGACPPYFYWSFNAQGYTQHLNKCSSYVAVSSRPFFTEALVQLGFDHVTVLVTAVLILQLQNNKLLENDKNSLEEVYRQIEKHLSEEEELSYQSKRRISENVIDTIFSKEYGERSELLQFLLVHGPFILVLDGLETLQNNEIVSDTEIPSSEILDKEMQLFITSIINTERWGSSDQDIQANGQLIVLTSRYRPIIFNGIKTHTIKNIEEWGIELPNNISTYRCGNNFVKNAINIVNNSRLFVFIDGKKYVSPLVINIITSSLHLLANQAAGNAKCNVKLLMDKIKKAREVESFLNYGSYECLQKHVTLATNEFLNLDSKAVTDGPALKRIQTIQCLIKDLAHFEYMISYKQLSSYEMINGWDYHSISSHEKIIGLVTLYEHKDEDEDSKAYNLHPLVKNTATQWLIKNKLEKYYLNQTSIAEKTKIIPVENVLNSNELIHAFRKAKHFLAACRYEKAQSIFEFHIQGKKYIAGNRFGMHSEILSLLKRFYCNERWEEGIVENTPRITQEWAVKVNNAAAHSLMSIGEPETALKIEKDADIYYSDSINGGEMDKASNYGEYIDRMIRRTDMALYAGEIEESIEFGNETVCAISEYSKMSNCNHSEASIKNNLIYLEEVAHGKLGYAYSWQSMLSPNDAGASESKKNANKHFENSERLFKQFNEWGDKSHPNTFDYYSLPHIIWRERFDAFQLRNMDWGKCMTAEHTGLKRRIDERCDKFKEGVNKGRIGYYSLNLTNLAIYEFRSALNNKNKIISVLDNLRDMMLEADRQAIISGKINFRIYASTSAMWHLRDAINNNLYLPLDLSKIESCFRYFYKSCENIRSSVNYKCYDDLSDRLTPDNQQ